MNSVEREKESFLSNFLNDMYDKRIAGIIVAIYTPIFLLFYGLSYVCYWSFFCDIFSFISGTSILFIAYIVAIIVFCDIRVERRGERDLFDRREPPFSSKSKKYKLTLVWFLVLLALGITAIVLTNRHRKDYAFDCETFFVDESEGLYHINDHCKGIEGDVVEMKGYEIREHGYNFCDICSDLVDEYESSDEYIRR